VHHVGGGSLKEGAASKLGGINVAKAYVNGGRLAMGVCRASLHWTDGGELITFASCHTDRASVVLEEREWVVGEVLAWLEQVGLSGCLLEEGTGLTGALGQHGTSVCFKFVYWLGCWPDGCWWVADPLCPS
jgi:hypothetical protein